MADPVLILQMQRLGDLILTFPLLEDLASRFPEHPLLVVAEEQFYTGLESFSPRVQYFPAHRLDELKNGHFSAVINLSSRPEAASFAGSCDAPLKIGPARKDSLRVYGFWQIYRANLTQNNRHNTFHWSDLNRLDLPNALPLTYFGNALRKPAGSKRIGLVVGASQNAKRPDAVFWGRLAARLAHNGFSPVFLGGAAEKALGAEAARLAGLRGANLCGRLALPELGLLLRRLALCITPDTGPMHLASWLGVPLLNLSMGPVHANDTGPALTGQWILRSARSCVGCWQCTRSRLFCKESFTPAAVEQLAAAIIRQESLSIPQGMELLRSTRDDLGLLRLESQGPQISARPVLEQFWRNAFLAFANDGHLPRARKTAAEMIARHGALAENMRKNLLHMLAHTLQAVRGGKLPADFWKNVPWNLRLFAGHCQLWLQNSDYSKQALSEILQREEILRNLLTG